MNTTQIPTVAKNLQVSGVVFKDYPDFCDAYFSYGEHSEDATSLTEDELNELTEQYPDVVNEMAHEFFSERHS